MTTRPPGSVAGSTSPLGGDWWGSAVVWPVRTARLLVRPVLASDTEASWQYRRLPQVGEWITRAPVTFEEHAAQCARPDFLAKTLVVELGGSVIGDLMVSVGDAWAQAEVADEARAVEAELGWALHPAHTGRGYATEAVDALLRLCFDDLGLRRVTAECFADNVASWRLMDRVGMRREAHAVGGVLHRSRGWLDGLTYALLAEEWRQAQAPTPGRPAGD